MPCAKSFTLLLSFLAVILSSALSAAESATDPEKKILGHWQGTGMSLLIEPVFKSDHTCYFADESDAVGTWSFKDGKYTIKIDETTFEAWFKSEGLLILKNSEDVMEVALRKKGEPASPTPSSTQPAPEGEWRFAYINKSSISAGPPFDAITIGNKKAILKFTPVDQQFEVECLTWNNKLCIPTQNPPMFKTLMNYMPLGTSLPLIIQLSYRWEDNGNKLILSNSQAVQPYNCEWVFMRPESFPANPLLGTWVGKGSFSGNMMDVRKDGLLVYLTQGDSQSTAETKPKLPIKYYRMWKSAFGAAISIVQLVPDMQLMLVQMSRIEIKGKDIILTPIECQYGETLQLSEEGKANWKLQGSDEKESETPAATNAATTTSLTPLDLAGDWTGSSQGMEMGFRFNLDGSVIWRMDEPDFRRAAPDGAKGQYKLTKGPKYHGITLYRFKEEDLEDRSFDGIIELIDDHSFRMELIHEAPLSEFSIEAIVFKRKGPKPQFSPADLAEYKKANTVPTEPPYKVVDLPKDTVTLPGGVKLDMVQIPSGSFVMGEPDNSPDNSWGTKPAHPVNIKYDFYLGRTEVTQAQWIAVMGKWPVAPDKSDPNGKFSPRGAGANFPAYYLSWDDCQAFVKALNDYIAKSGQGPANFRLPSEAEWEYACRAETQTCFYWGDDPSYQEIDDYAWNCNNSGATGMSYGVHEVGLKLPNPWGLYDMSGNVGEWCQDLDHSYKEESRPDDGSPWLDGKSTQRIQRGGSYESLEKGLLSAFRYGTLNYRNYDHGLRLARDCGSAK